ncbi:DUF4870 domain-containing protein [Cytobacillus purgationiresistens]|uniref:Tic20 family protein n=1 Tax=Cytobacillus purgationiresistens TaxID=863449 RepID=A0ABU0AQZ9_9BACI|nr:DUF4870 domain-containing protein [Cytobacillus purgationiresistens]MDQ0273703.1 putative Tic20 family protein [Cytobacillus purgationiresistens]
MSLDLSKDTQTDRLLAAAIYVSSFFTTFIGPLVIWLIKKDESPLVDHHGREYFNFIISYAVYAVICTVLMLVLIGFILIWLVGAATFIFTIIAAIKAFEGKEYRIPFVFRIL